MMNQMTMPTSGVDHGEMHNADERGEGGMIEDAKILGPSCLKPFYVLLLFLIYFFQSSFWHSASLHKQ